MWPDGRCLGTLGDPELDRIATRDALAALDRGVIVTRHYGPQGEARRAEVTVFMEVFAPPARLIIFGAVDFTRALVEVGKVLGFVVTVCDPRPVFATGLAFPLADEVVVEWPDRYLDRIGSGSVPGMRCASSRTTRNSTYPRFSVTLRTRAGYSAPWALGGPTRRDGRASWRRVPTRRS